MRHVLPWLPKDLAEVFIQTAQVSECQLFLSTTPLQLHRMGSGTY